MTTQTTAPQTSTARGEPRWFFGMLAEVKASAADTDGQYTLVEITVGPGYGTPLHLHRYEDEAFLMIEGEATFEVGDQVPVGTAMVLAPAPPRRGVALRSGAAGAIDALGAYHGVGFGRHNPDRHRVRDDRRDGALPWDVAGVPAAFADELDKIGVRYRFELFPGKHGGIQYRYPHAIRALAEALAP